MRIEIVLFLIAGLIIANIYTEGKYLKMVLSWKKYWQMAGIAVGALFLYWLLKKNPANAKQILMSSNEYIKYLPVDRNASSMLSPILDFTSKHSFAGASSTHPILEMPNPSEMRTQRMMQSGGGGQGGKTKRSVSETKKKFVASRQGWKCGDCGDQLNAWFEVDHKVRLEYGGSNHVDNLLALCRECHGKKTTMENL
jgi:HNH endonuclease